MAFLRSRRLSRSQSGSDGGSHVGGYPGEQCLRRREQSTCQEPEGGRGARNGRSEVSGFAGSLWLPYPHATLRTALVTPGLAGREPASLVEMERAEGWRPSDFICGLASGMSCAGSGGT